MSVIWCWDIGVNLSVSLGCTEGIVKWLATLQDWLNLEGFSCAFRGLLLRFNSMDQVELVGDVCPGMGSLDNPY